MATLEVIPPKIAARFWSKVDKSGDCWLWTAGLFENGYGQFYVPSAKAGRGAHRVAYMLTVGSIPDGMEIDHLCHVRACVRPDHLEAVPHKVNVYRGDVVKHWEAQRAKTHCAHGHEYTEANTYIRKDRPGRMCRACAAARASARYHAAKADVERIST